SNPRGTLIRDTAGTLFGTTYLGGAHNQGTVFKITWSGKFTVLYSFTGGADGGNPTAGLIRDPNDNLFGTTAYGGNLPCSPHGVPSDGCGVVFKVDTSGKETVLHTFSGADGAFPAGGIIAGGGSFYGTTVAGGTQDWGTIFSVRQDGTF